MKSVMNHSFSKTPDVKIQRSSFNRSHGHKTTFDAGWLIPVFIDEALPGDTFNLRMNFFGRLATPLVPVMDNIFLDSFFFAVPYRLIWENWERFNGAQDSPGDSVDFTIPVLDPTVGNLSTTGFLPHKLYDYFGLPTAVVGIQGISSLWSRAYMRIWKDWFRDQNLDLGIIQIIGDGPDNCNHFYLKRRNKRHDYFTSCLPWPQKGDSVAIPFSDSSVPVSGIGKLNNTFGVGPVNAYETDGTGASTYASASWIDGAGNDGYHVEEDPYHGGYPNIRAELSEATAGTINALRQAFQIQRLYEKDARGGTRYIELVRSHFGVVSDDARLQRAEYLGGGRSAIHMSPIAQTSEAGATPQANLAAIGTVSGSGHGFVKSFTEHCLVIGIVCAIADLTYQKGLPKMFTRSTRWDFYWPALANLGEQAVLSKEIFCDATGADENVFGYQERFAEYRYKPSMITGMFRSNHATSLDIWHLSQDFGARPVLATTFLQEDPPIDRVIATPAEPHIIFDSYFDLNCVRPMPVHSVPGLVDHF